MIINEQILEIIKESDLLKSRQIARNFAKAMGFNIVNQTKIITAVSELVRNVLTYAKRGTMVIMEIENGNRKGLKVSVKDEGPGIENIELALTEGYSTSGGLGKGLPGTIKLMDMFKIESKIGIGTEVEIIKWLT